MARQYEYKLETSPVASLCGDVSLHRVDHRQLGVLATATGIAWDKAEPLGRKVLCFHFSPCLTYVEY